MAPIFTVGTWTVAPDLNTISSNGTSTHLEPKAMAVLVRLAESPGETLSKEQLIRAVWPDAFVGDDVLSRSIYELRKAFGDDPREPRVIQTIAKRGYRLIAPVRQPVIAPPRKARAKVLALLSVLLAAIVIAATAYVAVVRRQRIAARPINAVAVLPLENLSGDPQQEYFADGMTESLITDLGRLTGLRTVIARASVMRYKGSNKPPAEIAHDLKVDALITGSVLRSGDRVRVNAQLIDPQSGQQLWTENYERNASDVLRLQSELTRAIAGEIRVKLTAIEQARLSSARSIDPQVYDAYLRGRFHAYKGTTEGFNTALGHYQEALRIDSAYAPAYAGISIVWHLRAYTGLVKAKVAYPEARDAAAKALELDNSLPEAHVSLAEILFAEWNWAAAEKEFERALELNPSDGFAHSFYSHFLYAVGRPQQAWTHVRRALELDPYNAFFYVGVGHQLIFREHRYAEARVQLEKAAAFQPESIFVHNQLWVASELEGDYVNALAEAKQTLRLGGNQDLVKALERGYARGGYRNALRAFADGLALKSKRGPVSAGRIAVLYARSGDTDRALDWFEKAYEERSGDLVYLRLHDVFYSEALRSHPRFQNIVRRMNFPQSVTLGKTESH